MSCPSPPDILTTPDLSTRWQFGVCKLHIVGLGLLLESSSTLEIHHCCEPHRHNTTTTSNYWVYWRQKARHSLQFLSICFIVLFLPSPVRWQRPRVNKKFCNSTTLPNPIESLNRTTRLTANRLPHFGGPHRYTLMPLKTRYNTPFVLGDDRGSGVSPRLPRWTRGVSAQDPHAPQTSTQTRDWHHEGKSLKLVSGLLGGEGKKKKKKKKHFSFLGFRALTCWGGPQVL